MTVFMDVQEWSDLRVLVTTPFLENEILWSKCPDRFCKSSGEYILDVPLRQIKL
jgi:hypothetical protein